MLWLTNAYSTLELPVFQFALHYSDGSVQKLPLSLTLTETTLNTSYDWLSDIKNFRDEAYRSLELWQFQHITHVTCMVQVVVSQLEQLDQSDTLTSNQQLRKER